MDKLKMHSKDKTQENFEILQRMFPNAVTETIVNGEVVRAIDKDILQQEINATVVDGREERYQFTWPDKKRAIISANAPVNKTLRPCREESVDFDNTENLYIEGDNLEVLKLLQETYLGKIKMIYIDPPYNTGHDFVYNDKFSVSPDEWDEMSGELDEYGNRLTQNTESNGRFHTDWLNMIYPRLKIARDLLADDGVIFISIDDNEVENLKKICMEVFGEINFIASIVVKSNPRGSMSKSEVASLHESLLLFTKNRFEAKIIGHELTRKMSDEYKFVDEHGPFRLLGLRMRGGFWRKTERPNLFFPIYINPLNGKISLNHNSVYCETAFPIQPSTNEEGTWRWSREKISSNIDFLIGKKVNRNNTQVWDVYQKDYLNRECGRRTKAKSIWDENEINYQNGTREIKALLGSSGIFDYSKPVFLVEKALMMIQAEDDDIILDFFSGSATTAHAVMRQNAYEFIENAVGKRRFIMIQLPEKTDEKSEAYKAGYQNICEIGKDRIRQAGSRIKEELRLASPIEKAQKETGLAAVLIDEAAEKYGEEVANRLDIGFRVLKLDSSNMKDVYYNPADFNRSLLDTTIDNIKEDRTPEDLLFQVMLDLGVLLSSKIEETEIAGKKVFNVADGYLMACFDADVNDETITAVAKQQPLYFVMRDSSLSTDTTATNFDQIFETYSPDTVRKVI